tara:strand:- start:22174 stop:22611 length:438 start_codon:yes stop_codon:yes gene_type:complete
MSEQTLETKLALVENDLKKMDGFFGRLDLSIEKITELNVSIREILSVHEQRISSNEEEIERMDIKYEQLHSRISTVQRELSAEIERDTATITEALSDLRTHMVEQSQREEERIRAVERRQWIIMGAAAALGFILGNAGLITKFIS